MEEWVYVKDFEDLEKLDIDTKPQYLCLMEMWNGSDYEWRALTAFFCKKGDVIMSMEDDNTPHKFSINKTGFYLLNHAGADMYEHIYRLNEVRWYKVITYPQKKPSEILTIEK